MESYTPADLAAAVGARNAWTTGYYHTLNADRNEGLAAVSDMADALSVSLKKN